MNYLDSLRDQFNEHVALQERRPGVFQLVAPLFHEDGDMIDVFLEPARSSSGKVRVCDHGMTLMRLSYTYDLDTANKERVFQQIISENRLAEENGNLFIEVEPAALYPAVLQFAQAASKIASMELYRREVIRSLFFEELTAFIEERLRQFNPRPRVLPLETRDDLEVDFEFAIRKRPLYLFGVKDNAAARLATISCLEFQKAGLTFKSLVVHEDFESLTRKDQTRITSAADKQFISLDDFREKGERFLEREVA